MKLVYDLLLLKHSENANEERDAELLSPLLFTKGCLHLFSCRAMGKGTDGKGKSPARQRKPNLPAIVQKNSQKYQRSGLAWPDLAWRYPKEL